MEPIDVKEAEGEGSSVYTIRPLKWVEKNRIRAKHTKITDIKTGKIEFDEDNYLRDIVKTCTLKDGKALTDADYDNIGAKTGDMIEATVNALNFLTVKDIQNLR